MFENFQTKNVDIAVFSRGFVMNNLMIDLETMGREPDAAIVAIGAVFFDEHTGQIGDTFYRTVHLATAVNLGFKIEASTVLFWLGQSQEARNAILFNAVHVRDAIQDFVEFVWEKGPKMGDLRVWGNSPAFDCIKLAAHIEACGHDVPWFYWAERCYRTIRDRNRVVTEDERLDLHNALSDAVHQAKHLIKIRQHHASKTKH